MSRRVGQKGNVYQHCKPWNPEAPAYGRFWVDVPGQPRQRRTISLGTCRTRTVAKQKLREHLESTGVNTPQAFKINTAPAMTFRAQAERWIESLPTRRRKPVKPATIFGWQHALNKWVLPNIGEKPLSEVSNGVLRELVEKMTAAGLSAQSIVTYSRVVKMVVASAVDEDGELLYPRKWNHDFIGLPIVEPSKQRRPTVTKPEVERIVSKRNGRWALLFALIASLGLRIGEALGLKWDDLSEDCTVLRVSRSIWHGREQTPKTPNAIRVVDVPKPLADVLQGRRGEATAYVFHTQSGGPLQSRNALRALHASGKKVGFHALRRFRTETLRRARVPEDLIRLWLGHAKQTVTDLYAAGLEKDEAWRREWCDRAGLGFELIGLLGLQKASKVGTVKAA